jgi:hypothetical protein
LRTFVLCEFAALFSRILIKCARGQQSDDSTSAKVQEVQKYISVVDQCTQ